MVTTPPSTTRRDAQPPRARSVPKTSVERGSFSSPTSTLSRPSPPPPSRYARSGGQGFDQKRASVSALPGPEHRPPRRSSLNPLLWRRSATEPSDPVGPWTTSPSNNTSPCNPTPMSPLSLTSTASAMTSASPMSPMLPTPPLSPFSPNAMSSVIWVSPGYPSDDESDSDYSPSTATGNRLNRSTWSLSLSLRKPKRQPKGMSRGLNLSAVASWVEGWARPRQSRPQPVLEISHPIPQVDISDSWIDARSTLTVDRLGPSLPWPPMSAKSAARISKTRLNDIPHVRSTTDRRHSRSSFVKPRSTPSPGAPPPVPPVPAKYLNSDPSRSARRSSVPGKPPISVSIPAGPDGEGPPKQGPLRHKPQGTGHHLAAALVEDGLQSPPPLYRPVPTTEPTIIEGVPIRRTSRNLAHTSWAAASARAISTTSASGCSRDPVSPVNPSSSDLLCCSSPSEKDLNRARFSSGSISKHRIRRKPVPSYQPPSSASQALQLYRVKSAPTTMPETSRGGVQSIAAFLV